MLCEGGVWINLGPLLWHFHDVLGETSVELSWEVRVFSRSNANPPAACPPPHRVREVHCEKKQELLHGPSQELRALILSHGFVIESEEWRRCAYTTNARSLYQTAYDCVFFIARKSSAPN